MRVSETDNHRQVHILEIAGSTPVPATKRTHNGQGFRAGLASYAHIVGTAVYFLCGRPDG